MRGQIEVDTEIELDDRLSGEEERVVYRLAQEALNNVVKHAGAKRASLSASVADGALRIVIGDDGAGFDPSATGQGRGLAGMRERAALLGGRIEVRSEPGKGTEVLATLPLSA